MKAISILQPWASLIAIDAKKIETRSWSTKYRGPLAIHASKGFSKSLRDLCNTQPFKAILTKAGLNLDNLPLGKIVATCNLVDCIKMTPEFIDFIESAKGHEREFGDYAVGRYAWILEDIKPLEKPIPVKGALSLWEWEVNP
ncbi:MAG TPA: ASCH domain-containing protein [Desulfosporosinus sp.]|nr:ASCH domain-containing protein [Desulfosporosinus sp.]